jgi:hypothetical protein
MEEIGVAKAPSYHQIHPATENLLQSPLEIAVPGAERSELIALRILDEEVDVTAIGIESAGSRRSEEFQSRDIELSTESNDFVSMFLDARDHDRAHTCSKRLALRKCISAGYQALSVDFRGT